jgi:hypothetical protein
MAIVNASTMYVEFVPTQALVNVLHAKGYNSECTIESTTSAVTVTLRIGRGVDTFEVPLSFTTRQTITLGNVNVSYKALMDAIAYAGKDDLPIPVLHLMTALTDVVRMLGTKRNHDFIKGPGVRSDWCHPSMYLTYLRSRGMVGVRLSNSDYVTVEASNKHYYQYSVQIKGEHDYQDISAPFAATFPNGVASVPANEAKTKTNPWEFTFALLRFNNQAVHRLLLENLEAYSRRRY